MSVDIKFGSYDLGVNIDTYEVEEAIRINQQAIVRRHGLVSDDAYRGGMAITIGGLILELTDTLSRAVLNALKNALSQGKQPFTLYSDKKIDCKCNYFSYSYEEGDLRRIRWEARLVSDDYGFVDVDQTVTEKTITSSPQTEAFVQNGNIETPPVIRITAGSSDIETGLRIDNLTTGKYFTIGMAISAGDYLEIDVDALTVVDQDGVNQLAKMNGDFFTLAAGSNSIKWTGTATGSPTLTMTFRGKYDGA